MYEPYFGFQQTPFRKDLAPASLYPARAHKEAVARLVYAANRRLVATLTGAVGAGKTMALRALHDRLDPAHYQVLYLAEARLTPRTFYRHLARQLNLEPAHFVAEAKHQVQRAILHLYQERRQTPVVIVDEAHLLGKDMLEEIRFLVNFHMDSVAPLALILAGQPELRRTLSLSAFEAINQRIQIRMHLDGLDPGETKSYIQHQIESAGCDRPLFTTEAVQLIHRHTQGIPRKINNLCTSCLLMACSREESIVDDRLVNQVMQAEYVTPT